LEKQVHKRTKELEISKEELRMKVEALENNKTAMLNIMLDLKKTIADLEEARRHINKQNMELKAAQKELSSLNKELESKVKERTAEVEKLLKQKDEFIGQLGHDLKNPLTPLVGLLPMLEEREKDPKTKGHLGVIIRNVQYMRDLVIKTLQLARINSPSTTFDIKDMNLLDGINNVLENQQILLKENNIAVENKIYEDIFVKADKLRLEELLGNLFINAIKYTVDSKGKIIVDAQEKDGIVTVSIKDTGIGMTKEQLSKIFDEFYKADESRHEMDSSGLGLSICRRIVEKHGGRIWAESNGKGKGSTFYFTLKSSNEKDK
jgi:signal transduction histidine kinase